MKLSCNKILESFGILPLKNIESREMNRVMATKKSPPKSSQTLIQPASKRPRKEKHINPPVTKKYKSSRSNTSKVKKVAKNGKLMNEWAENESSKGEIYEKTKQPKNVRKSVSSESVIYVGSYKTQNFQRRTIPIIDLTESSEHISMNKENIHPKKLRTLYFPERNFDRMTKLRKCLTTTSLITIPVTKKIEMPPRQLSTSDLKKKLNMSKLAPLDIPAKYVDWSDINISQKSRAVLDKVKLTESDYEMIDWIIENDRGVEMEFSLSPSTSGYDSSINRGMSIEEFMKIYDNE